MIGLKKFKLISWNVRGLGGAQKCCVVRDVIRASRCEICCLQETKINTMDVEYLARALPSFFERNCVYVNAIESRGGMLISWKRCYTLKNAWVTRHSCTALLQQSQTGRLVAVTNVYGPSTDAQKPAFIRELRALAPLINLPWTLVGDFNVVRWLIDRSGGTHSFPLMNQFNDLLSFLQVQEISLQNRQFTWSSKRPNPSFSKLDRAFVSTDLSLQFPLICLVALEMSASDHAPLLLTCRHNQTTPKEFRLEKGWFRYHKMKEIVDNTWQQGVQEGARGFQSRCNTMHRRLRQWHLEEFGKLT